jgi:glycosyltransferase involved in cell wall biosynthesis
MNIKVLHIISGLKIGGTEKFLVNYIIKSSSIYEHEIISLSEKGKMTILLDQYNIKYKTLNFKKNFLFSFFKLISIIKVSKPHKVQTWLYHANFIGGLASFFAGNNKIFWSLRGTSIPQSFFSFSYLVILLGSFFSYFIPKVIICNGNSVKNFHIKLFYCKKKIGIIHNGFDPNIKFKENLYIKSYINSLPKNSIIIGAAGRYDKLKDYPNLFEAYSQISKNYKNIYFLFAGRNMNLNNFQINKLITKNNLLEKNIKFFDELDDLNYFFSVLDIFCLSSYKEGFPNVLCEAMINEVPCVSTNCGEVSLILENVGQIVPSKNSKALSVALEKYIQLNNSQRKAIGNLSKKRIKEKFLISECVNKYDNLYKS